VTGARMARTAEEVGASATCSCGKLVWRERVLKGPNAGAWRTLNPAGNVHRCGPYQRSREWTRAELDYVARNIGPMTAEQIAQQLQRTVMGVHQAAGRINKQRRTRHV